MAVVVDLDGLAAEELVGDAEVRHVGPAGRAVNGEEAEARGGDVVELRVAVGHQLVALLGGGVERDGIVDAVFDAEGNLLVAAVNRARRSIHEVPHRMVPAGFEYIIEADDVALDIDVRILDRIAHARLRRQVDDDVEPILFKQFLDQIAIGDAAADEGVTGMPGRAGHDVCFRGRVLGVDLAEAIFLQCGIVVVVEIVEADDVDGIGAVEETEDEVGADEAGAAGNQNVHYCFRTSLRPSQT